MTLMDDFRRKTEDGLKTLKETAEGIAFNVEKQARIAGKKMDIMRIQRKVQKLYTEVGEYVYEEFALERPIALEAPFLKERMTAISRNEGGETRDRRGDRRGAQNAAARTRGPVRGRREKGVTPRVFLGGLYDRST